MGQRLEISIPSAIANIAEVEIFIGRIFENIITRSDFPDKRFGQISLSIIEAISNSITSGNEQDITKMVTVVAEKIKNKLKVIVSDEGKGFDYSIIPDPTTPENIGKESKRGLFLMKTLTDEDLIFENNGATVIMTFDLDK